MDMERRFLQLQRATVARSALDVIAIIFLCAGFAFWGVAFWQLLGPPAILSLLSIQAVVLALVFSLAAPLLLSMLVPTTPAGQLLQKTQWRTIGFPVIIVCAGFLLRESYILLSSWLSAQGGTDPASGLPTLQASGQVGPLSISLVIAFVVIPALAWVQLTPERFLEQIQQAHAVKKLEMQQRGEMAIIKASILRAERLALKGWAELLPLEQQEVFGTVRGLLQSTSDIQRDIVRTLGMSSDLERTIMDDEAISAELAYVARALDVLPDLAPAHQDAAPASPPLRPAPPEIAPPRPAAPRRAPPRYAAEYEAMLKRAEHSVWGVGDLAVVIGKSDRAARDRIAAWMDEGLVARDADGKNVYYFTERGGA